MTANPLELAPRQTSNFKLFEEDRTVVRLQNSEDEAKNGTLAATALTQDDETFLRLYLQRKIVSTVLSSNCMVTSRSSAM